MYELKFFKLFHSFDDHIYRTRYAEQINNVFRMTLILTLLSMMIYGVMGYFGIGSQLILESRYTFSAELYEAHKLWFMIGQVLYGFLFALGSLFIPALIFKWLFPFVAFKKLMTMQFTVLAVLLIERLTWIPLATLFHLDAFVSPLSFGVLASIVTTKSWIIYFFGALSLFKLFVIVFQIRFLKHLLEANNVLIYVIVICLHFFTLWFVALLTFMSPYIIEGWF